MERKSPHHAVIINQGPWTKPWQAIGVAFTEDTQHCG